MTEAKPMTAQELALVREILPQGQGASRALALDLIATIDALTARAEAAEARVKRLEDALYRIRDAVDSAPCWVSAGKAVDAILALGCPHADEA